MTTNTTQDKSTVEGNKLIPHFSKDYWSHKRQMERQANKLRKDFKRFHPLPQRPNKKFD